MSTFLSRPGRLALLCLTWLALATTAQAAPRPQTITVVMDNNYPPYIFENGDGKLQGILIDQWRLWEEKTGIKVEISAMSWGQALSRMEAGEFEVIDTIFKNEKRSTWLDFTPAYAKLEVPIFFDKNIAGITDAASLRGFAVAAKTGDDAVELLHRHGIDNLLLFDSYEAIIRAAKDHKINVFVADKPPALYFLYKFDLHNQFKFSPPLHVGEFHRAVAKGRDDLREVVEEGFSRISAAEYQKIESTWSGSSLLDHLAFHHLFTGVATLGALILILLTWNGSLRRMVRTRTAELKSSEERFQAIYNAVNEAIFIHDLESGAILDVNQRTCEMYGYSRAEACALAVEGFSGGLPPYSQAEALAWVGKAAHGEAQLFEWQAKHKDGHLFWVEVNMRRAQIDNHDRILVSVRDISGRKGTEEALRKSQTMLKHILDSVPQYIFWKDRESNYLGCNRVFAHGAGLQEPEEIIGKSDFDLPWRREESEAYRADDRYVMDNNAEKLHIIEQQLQANGQQLWVDTSKVPLLTADGQVYGVLGVYDDITARKRVEQELLREKSFSDAVINSLPGVFYVYEDCTRLIKWNKNFEKVSGLSFAELWHQHPLALVSNGDKERVGAEIAKVAATGEVGLVEAEVRLQGQTVPYLMTGSLLTLGGKNHLIGIGIDVTEKRKLEAGLRQAQKMESIGTLAGGIAHDFNNILSAIIGYADLAMIRQEGDEGSLEDDLKQLRRAADRASALVRQILTFSRKQQKEKMPLQLYLVVKETLKLLRASIPTTIEIRQAIDSNGALLADPTEMHQLIMNLCTNAFHAMQERGGVLGVALTEMAIDQPLINSGTELPPGRYLCLEVSDTGCGMDKETIAKIFDPYFTTKEIGKGTGLGLAVVHGIVESHHGRITVYSEVGRGTTFTVYLPMIAQVAAAPAPEKDPPQALAHERVMVVDDEAPIRDLIRKFLTQAGYRVTCFANGCQAWEALVAQPDHWDILITDQTMPEMTGAQLALRVQSLRPTLPIILCSGYSALVSGEQFKKSGVAAFLQKPLSRVTLLTQVARCLADSGALPKR